MINKKEYFPLNAYVLVSQGIAIDYYFVKELALKQAKKSNEYFHNYKQECIERNIPYADIAVYVYQNGNLIANEWGEV